MIRYHESVLVEEVIAFMRPEADKTYLDATVGTGGHAEALLARSSPTGRLIGIDTDAESLEIARQRLAPFGDRAVLVHGRYEEADSVLHGLGVSMVDGIVLDLGLSSYQLAAPGRGFSFQRDEPLDMRMDRSTGATAGDLLRRLSAGELARLLREYGEERWAARIGKGLVDRLAGTKDATTRDVVEAIMGILPPRARRQRIHPATRTFQALRIAVNRELEALEVFLGKLPFLLSQGGRACIISFHSLEDRLVKRACAAWVRGTSQGLVCRPVHKKAIRPSQEEVARNPRARSARMRVIERVADEKCGSVHHHA